MSLYKCEADLKGDLVTWTASRWSQQDGATSSSVPYQTFCQKSFSDEVILLPDAMSYDRAQFMCGVLSGDHLLYDFHLVYKISLYLSQIEIICTKTFLRFSFSFLLKIKLYT